MSNKRQALFAACVATVLVFAISPGRGVNLSAQAPTSVGADPALLATYQWRSIGPDRGGRSIAVAGVKGQPNIGYFGATGGGLWKTTDGGETWAPVTDGQIGSASVGAVAVTETQSRHRLHRHGRVVHPRQHHAGRRRLQVDRRRQDMDAHRPARRAEHLEDPHPSDEPGHRLRRRVRPARRAERRARHFQEHRRRQDLAEASCSATPRPAAIDLSIDRNNPNVIYAALVGGVPQGIQMSSGGPGSGLFKSTDGGETWTEITRNPGMPAGVDRPHRRRGLRRRFEPRLRARRERERRPVQLGRRRRDVDAGQHEPQHPPARVLLHARHRRSRRTRTPSTC